MKTRIHASASLDGVELAADGTPKAFRIWRKGNNQTEYGPTIFSERSARLLMKEQANRGVRYSIDVDHCSLDKNAPIANHAAVGWHNLEVRNGELWAVDVTWTTSMGEAIKRGEFRYTSAAYDVDSETKEVVSYLNIAVTNSPATWNTTALAATRGSRATGQTVESMSVEELRARAKLSNTQKFAIDARLELRARGETINGPTREQVEAKRRVHSSGRSQVFPAQASAPFVNREPRKASRFFRLACLAGGDDYTGPVVIEPPPPPEE